MDEIVNALREFGIRDPRIQALYLFGSQARGDAHAGSDIDIGVLFSEPQTLWDTLLPMEGDLEELLGTSVDLVDVAKARPFLALDVIRGERAYCADPDGCDRFELYVMARAGDLAYYERQRIHLALSV
jgi:predicted nucleotidyltransferase